MMIFDAHLDMAWNACEWNRNLLLPVSEIRQFEKHFDNTFPGPNTVSWPELRRGGVGTIVATLLPRLHRRDKALTFYQSREAAFAASCGQLAYYRAMVARGHLRELSDRESLQHHVAEWRKSPDRSPIGFILSMEGSWSVLSPDHIAEWFAAGLRALGPAHYGPDFYCHGTGSDGGLKEDGPALLREMERVGMILDATHLADKSFWQALEIFGGPVLASHHNCRALVPGDRQLTDEQIKALIARGAVIGASFDNWMLKPGWKIGVSAPESVTLEDVVNHTDHICQIAGNARHCGLGTDLDGGFGKEQSPHDLDTVAELPKIADILSRRGYSQDDIEAILARNFVEFFNKSLPSRTPPTKSQPAV
jgi:membrane dipeptidase